MVSNLDYIGDWFELVFSCGPSRKFSLFCGHKVMKPNWNATIGFIYLSIRIKLLQQLPEMQQLDLSKFGPIIRYFLVKMFLRSRFQQHWLPCSQRPQRPVRLEQGWKHTKNQTKIGMGPRANQNTFYNINILSIIML